MLLTFVYKMFADGAGTVIPFGAPEVITVFSVVCVAQFLDILFCHFVLGFFRHCIVCYSSNYDFWLHLLCLQNFLAEQTFFNKNLTWIEAHRCCASKMGQLATHDVDSKIVSCNNIPKRSTNLTIWTGNIRRYSEWIEFQGKSIELSDTHRSSDMFAVLFVIHKDGCV